MVAEQADGTRRIYHLQEQGLHAVQAYLEGIWGDAAARFRLLAENTDETVAAMTAPLTLSFDVACSVEHAFEVWTAGIGSWWPSDHTVTGRSDLVVVLRGGVGGRIYERTADGVEHDWGEVTVWKPPTQLPTCGICGATAPMPPRWRSDSWPGATAPPGSRSSTAAGSGSASAGAEWREQNQAGWQTLLPHYRDAIAKGDTMMAAGTKEDPWVLTTPPGSSEYTMYKDDAGRSPRARVPGGFDDVEVPPPGHRRPARLVGATGRLGRPRRRRREEARRPRHRRGVGTVADNPVGGWYGLRNGYRGSLRHVPAAAARGARAWPRSPTIPATTRCGRSETRHEETTMTVTKVIRYKTKPESADENERLVRAVFAELATKSPEGLHYATFRLDDGVSFVHVAVLDGEENPLNRPPPSPSSSRGSVVAGRRPRTADATVVGSYRFFAD